MLTAIRIPRDTLASIVTERLRASRSGHGHGHRHGPSAVDALTSGARYCRPRVLDRARDVLRDHDHITHATVQVEPTDHKGCNEVLW
jgi:hypothetical protein